VPTAAAVEEAPVDPVEAEFGPLRTASLRCATLQSIGNDRPKLLGLLQWMGSTLAEDVRPALASAHTSPSARR
jgi:hypothetical protein